jgi:Tfp pilus assembly protein PilF
MSPDRGSITDLVQHAAALRAAQQMENALEVISRAAKRDPDDPRAALGLAQISFETWRPAASLFAAAQRLSPGNPDLIRNRALALAAEGEVQAAVQLLRDTLAVNGAWVDGHRTLANLRITHGEAEDFDESYAAACRVHPDNVALRMAWFQHHVLAKNWARARTILTDAKAAIGPNRSLDLAAIFLASESGGGDGDDAMFDPHHELRDPGLDLCHVRHCLRVGQADRAEQIAARHLDTPAARMFWPYLSLCWRLQDDHRARWLDGDPLYVQTMDLNIPEAELAALADVLRGLHRLKSPYPEQSVRGGTQTDRQLFFHPDAAIQRLKSRIVESVDAYLASLPAADSTHPLLRHPRDMVRFEGSWSVRLSGSGFHACHTHPLGWISSAFYVALPDPARLGPEPSGWLELGTPPPELGLSLAPYVRIAPKPGRLALFPSTMWHGTCPFDDGERLTIAFDVSCPQN